MQKNKEKKRQQQEYLKEANSVVIISRGKKYHHSWCQIIKGSPRTITIKQALKRGYKPCGTCEPPDREVTLANSGIDWDGEINRRAHITIIEGRNLSARKRQPESAE